MTAMTSAPVLAEERNSSGLGPARRPAALWTAFAVVHLLLMVLCRFGFGWPLGDVDRVYLGWAQAAATGGEIVGITTEFVYPLLALVPILLPFSFGSTWYAIVWLLMVTVLNAVAFAFLISSRIGSPHSHRRRTVAAWWWLCFLVLLGPIALARIDSVTVPIVIVALLLIRTRPFLGAVLLTIATWIKVWPAAVIAALLVASRDRLRLAAVAAGTSALIAVVALILGSGANLWSFVGQQTARGIQIESPIATVWMWQTALGVPGSFLYYDKQILTFQVTGQGIDLAIAVMTPLLALAAATVLLLGWRAQRLGADFARLFPALVLALIMTMIVFNKVGSPQFISWLAAPVILGLVVDGRAWRRPAILAAVIGVLTHLFYPYLYHALLIGHPVMVTILTARNLLELVVLGWAVQRLWALPQRLDR